MLLHRLRTQVKGAPWARWHSTNSYSSVDASEVKKFSDMAAGWWNPHGQFAMLQLLNPPRVAYVRDHLSKETSPWPLKGKRMLDIGCGGGLLSEALVRLGANVIGADASSDNIQMAKLHAQKDPLLWKGPGSLEYRNVTAEELLAQGEQFDAVVAMEIIEHVNQPLEFLRTCANLTRAGGDLFLSTLSRTPAAYALTIVLAEKLLKLVHNGTHDWSKYIKSRELCEAIESFGKEWSVVDTRGISWNPICRTWELAPRNGHVGFLGLESLEINYIMRAKRSSESS